MKVIVEHFNSVQEYLDAINSRSNNSVMSSQYASKRTGDKKWHGTKSYEEATELFKNGYVEILDKVLKGVNKSYKISLDSTYIPHNRPKNSIIGYVPNIPNAILNIPESMITTDRVIHKRKTINLLYSVGVDWRVDIDSIINAGIALITAIKIIENSGISVNLDIAPLVTFGDREICNHTITLKRYCDRLDIQKLCFPLANPSMERRFGFKWLETYPEITDEQFSHAYGQAVFDLKEIRKSFSISKETRLLNTYWIMDHNYDVLELINYLKNA